jgi:hypothetical protein
MMRRNKKKDELTLADVTNRLRGFILDSQIQNAHELSVILGCSPLSDELQEKEEEESDNRVDKIGSLIPLLYAHAHVLAEGAVEFQRANVKNDALKNLPDEMWWESRKLMEQMALSVLLGSVSQLVDMGLVTVTKKRKY